jgi:pyruvate dehydrogenase E2 component (dihydrolipoamide acetyltransferase)
MATKVVMEALSPTMEEGRLVEWKKQEGDAVATGDVLAEVETDKAVMELLARSSGTLIKQLVKPGTTVPVAQVVGYIGEPGEQVDGGAAAGAVAAGAGAKPAEAPAAAPASPKPSSPERQGTQPAPDRNQPTSMPPAPPAHTATERRDGATRAPALSAAAPAAAPAPAAGRVKASPLARRIAADRGIDLGRVSGSGPEGRVIARDLEQAPAAAGAGSAGAGTPARAPTPLARGADTPAYVDTPLTQIRKTIAKRLSQSIGPIPTFYLTTEVDMERVWEARAALVAGTDGAQGAPKVSFNDIIIKAVASALRRHPACNAWWQDDHIRFWNEVHVGMAVAIDEGLITPVIRDADLKSLTEIAADTQDLVARARARKLTPEEYTGSTFSISNLGMLDIDEFTAVINPPEAGILAVGRIVEKPVVDGGEIAVRRRMRLTMSCDHRVIDGATGAQFLKTLKSMLENPLALVW